MIDAWINDFQTASRNALTRDWFISPLEYHWTDGKRIIDAMFRIGDAPSPAFDEMISPELYRSSMQVDFRAKMMVFAFMREPIARSFGVEIENGLLNLYQLDFLSCISQCIYVVEGYCRKLFNVSSLTNVKSVGWTIPTTGNAERDRVIRTLSGVSAESSQNRTLRRLVG